jgi:hypothetical protein
VSDLRWSLSQAEAIRAMWSFELRPQTVARGLALQRSRKVLGLRFEGAVASASVVASGKNRPYVVQLEVGVEPGDESMVCTCPYEQEFACKHLVALLLEVSEHLAAQILADAEAEPVSEALAASGLSVDRRGCVPAPALLAWAAAHDVEAWLEDDAGTLLGELGYTGHYWVWANLGTITTVAQLLTGERPQASTPTRDPGQVYQYREAVIGHLERRAEINTVARAEQALMRAARVPPSEPLPRAAWDRLTTLEAALGPPRRWRLVKEVAPRRATLQEGSANLLVTSARHACRWSPGLPGRVVVSAGFGDAPAAVRCDCDHPAGCPEALAGVEVALAMLADGRKDREAVEWRRAVSQAPWERAMARLDRLLAAAAAPVNPDGRELGWRLQLNPTLAVEPTLVRPYKNKKGWSCEVVRAHDVEQHVHGPQARQDRAAAALTRQPALSYEWNAGKATALRTLRELVGHPRLFMRESGRGVAVPITLERGEATLAVTVGEGGRLDIALDLPGRRVSVADAALMFMVRAADGLYLDVDEEAGRFAICEVDPMLATLVRELGADAAGMPAAALPAVVARLPRLAEVTPLRLAPELRGEAVEGWRGLIVRLELEPSRALLVSLAVQPLAECAALPPGEGPEEMVVFRDDRAVHCLREHLAEVAAADELARTLGLDAWPTHLDSPAFSWRIEALDQALEIVARTAELDAETTRVEWADAQRVSVASAPGLDALALEVRKKRDWFDMAGELRLEHDVIPLGKLLQAIRAGQRFVSVGPDRWVRLNDAVRDALSPLAHLEGTGHSLSRFAIAAVDGLAEAGAALELPPEWLDARKRVDEAATLDPPLPEGFAGELRGYQRDGYRWMCRLAHWGAGACLADDMGLGKTIQALALLAARAGEGPALVVAPTSVGFNWQRECERFAPGLRPLAFRGKADLEVFEKLGAGTVLITSYDLVVRYGEPFTDVAWGTLVLDEAQAAKNPETRRARAVQALSAGFRLALTGTPVENRTIELWSLFQAVTPGLLGAQGAFRERFVVPIERDGDAERRALLASLVRPFILRRLKTDVAKELPPRTEVDLRVELSAAERRLYDEVRQATLADLANASGEPPERRAFRVLTALTRLRQLACHPRLVHPKTSAGSAKIKALTELLVALRDEGHRALVFSQFTSLLALAKDALDAAGLTSLQLDGSTEGGERRRLVDAFQAGEGDAFLLSLKAGGTGLNLTAADYVVHLDPWWNPAVEDQATDRAHRIGQTRPVTVYRLIAADTVEDEMLRLHADKRELAEALLSGTGGGRALSADDLARLLQATRAPEEFEADEFDDDAVEAACAPAPAKSRRRK